MTPARATAKKIGTVINLFRLKVHDTYTHYANSNYAPQSHTMSISKALTVKEVISNFVKHMVPVGFEPTTPTCAVHAGALPTKYA